jgi:hypothetical protein
VAALLALVSAVLVCSPAWAYMPASSRGIYYAGKVHYVSVDNNAVFHTEGLVVEGNWMGPWENAPTASLPLAKGWNRQDPQEYGAGEATIVLGGVLVHYAVLFDSFKNPMLCVSRYDMTLGVFLPDRNGQMFPVPITQVTKSATGTYAVAATVYDDLIYVFTSEFTLTSADAMSYSRLPAIADGLSDYNARDAITFYPAEGMPKVMVVFANPNKKTGGAVWVVWDGSASLPLPFSDVRTFSNHFIGAAVLTMGTSGGVKDAFDQYIFAPGAKVPTIQMVDTEPDYYQGSGMVYLHEYNIEAGTMTLKGVDGDDPSDPWHPYLYGPIRRLRVYPWYTTEYDSHGRPVLKQYIGINFYYCTASACVAHKWARYALRSDTLVPQNHDDEGNFGWQGIPTFTGDGTAEELAVRQKYWSLLGVILGPPPFVTNDMDQKEVKEFSNVEYGLDFNNKVDHNSSWSDTVMMSSKSEMKAGIKKMGKGGGIKASLEVGYKHGWEGSRTIGTSKSVGINFTAGTVNETEGNFGTHGWVILSTPTLLSQVHKIYAYDYDVQAETGTYLDMDMPTIVQALAPTPESPPPLTVNGYSFELENPGGTGDQAEIAGLLSGMGPFPRSTDLEGWKAMTWDRAGAPWKNIYGTGQYGSAPVVTVSQGSYADITFTNETEDVETTGQTNSTNMEVGVSFSFGTKVKGFTETLKMGYEGEWSMDTTTTTAVSNDIQISYHFPFKPAECQEDDCVTSLTVQPYLLQATDSTADWIPTAYAHDLPWCMTWRVKDGMYNDGTHIGESAPPESVEGIVTGGGGAGRGKVAPARSIYTLNGGWMEWLHEDGTSERIPIGADEFDPSLGASVLLNGHELRTSDTLGTWKKKGQTWEYTTNGPVRKDVFTLTLDFKKARWSFDGRRLDLARSLRAGETAARLELVVNGRYTFFCDIEHDAKIDWSLLVSPPDDDRPQMTSYMGTFNSSSGHGEVLLEGVLPAQLAEFGDFSIVVNGHRNDIPLLTLEPFWGAFENGEELVFERDGIYAVLDFGNKTWSVRLSKGAFHRLLTPRWGGVRVRVEVGGDEKSSREIEIPSYTTRLSFQS